jgi:cardiolipin synthase
MRFAIMFVCGYDGMRIDISLFRAFSGLLVMLMLAGCATTSPRSRYLEQMDPGSLTNLVAYCAGDSLEIRYPFHGKDTFAHATWPAEQATGFPYCYAGLTFDKEPHATRRVVVSRGHRLTIRTAQQWRQLVDEVFQGLMPEQAGHGVLFLVQGQELVVFRDQAGLPQMVKLANKPAAIVIDRTFSDDDFSRKAIELLEKNAGLLAPGQTQFLFVTGEEPAFVLMDLRRHFIVFLSYPVDPESEPLEVPGWFTLKALNSLVIRSFVITAVKNPFSLIGRGLWHIGNTGATMLDAGTPGGSSPPPPLYHGPGMNLTAWEKQLDKLVAAKRYWGKVDYFIDGENFFSALLQSIESARRSVDVQVYIFDTDEYAVTIADVLKERSATVRVRVLLDDMGSLFAADVARPNSGRPVHERPDDIKSYLTAGTSRVKVRATSNPWLTVDHRKCFIIDGRQAYVGGMNIGQQYRYDWHDMMVGLTGPVVGRLENDYRKAWAYAGPGGDFAYLWVKLFDHSSPSKKAIPGDIEIRPLRTSTGQNEIYRAQLAAIRQAKGYIYIENPYFCDDTILRELIRARQRGVDVRVILPGKSDIGVMQTSNLLMANEMIRHGIRVFAYPGMTHVKAAIYDGWACLGSANLDKMSLRISQELDVAFSDPATVNRLKQELFETDFSRAREMKKPVPLSWMDSLVKVFADQF